MARRARKKRRGASKTLTQRVSALEKAIMPKAAGRTRKPRIIYQSGREDITPPHIRRQLGL